MNDVMKTEKSFTDWMNEGLRSFETSSQMTKRLKTMKGLSLSIQASWSHYSEPRKNSPQGDYAFYREFEIGFPSTVVDDLLPYAESPDDPTETVYGYVPKEVIEKVVNDFGGIVGFDEGE